MSLLVAHLRHVGMSVVSPLLDEDQTCNRPSGLGNSSSRRRLQCRPIVARGGVRAHCVQWAHDGSAGGNQRIHERTARA